MNEPMDIQVYLIRWGNKPGQCRKIHSYSLREALRVFRGIELNFPAGESPVKITDIQIWQQQKTAWDSPGWKPIYSRDK